MDPLSLNSYLNDLILQHLNINELLEFSTISKLWSTVIGESQQCMRRIKFSLKFWKSTEKQKQTDEKIEILKNITRKYQHLSIDCRFDKNLSVELWNVLKQLETTLVTLKIKSIKLDNPTALHFLRLHELKLVYVPLKIRNILVTSSSSFKQIKLKLISPLNWKGSEKSDPDSLAAIRKCLEENDKLKDLEIHGSVQYSFLFDEDLSDVIKFKLQKFKVKSDMRLALISEKNENNLIKFLSGQSSSLEEIFIDVCRPHVIEHVFNKMPMLWRIQIETVVKDFKVKDLKLILNERIVELKIPYVNHHDDIREILSITPNLETLFVAHLSHETMNYIAWNLKKLKSLKYRYDEIDCEMLYEKLKDENEEVNQNIEMIVDYEYT